MMLEFTINVFINFLVPRAVYRFYKYICIRIYCTNNVVILIYCEIAFSYIILTKRFVAGRYKEMIYYRFIAFKFTH